MVEAPPDVPSALLLLTREIAACESTVGMRKRIRQLLPELREQSEVYAMASAGREGYQQSALRFDVHMHGALDLLSGEGCIKPACRVAAADRLARSVGLIADRVWLTDFLSERFLHFGRATNEKLNEVIVDTLVLSRLLPLILAGVVKFRSPWVPTCTNCLTAFEEKIEVASESLRKLFRRDFKIERTADGGWVARTGQCLTPTIFYKSRATDVDRMPTVADFSRHWIAEQVRSISWVAREASLDKGVLFSNSRVGLAGLALQEGRLSDKRTLMVLESERSIDVPWVSDLSALQIVQLRQEASKALPAFREQMAEALCTGGGTSPQSFIHDLRAQATDVQAELVATRSKSARVLKATYGLLGLGLSAYGIATDQVAPSVTGLLPILQLLIAHKTGHEAEVMKLESRPGYVLVKAQQLLAHEH